VGLNSLKCLNLTNVYPNNKKKMANKISSARALSTKNTSTNKKTNTKNNKI
jgi:hypothetical protein